MIPKTALPKQDEYYDDEEDYDNYDSEEYYDYDEEDSSDGLFDDEPEQELQYGQHSKPFMQQQPAPVTLQQ